MMRWKMRFQRASLNSLGRDRGSVVHGVGAEDAEAAGSGFDTVSRTSAAGSRHP